MHKILFYNKFIICLYMFRALCAHHQEVNIVLYSLWYRHTRRWPSRAQVERRLIIIKQDYYYFYCYYKTRFCALSWLITKIIKGVLLLRMCVIWLYVHVLSFTPHYFRLLMELLAIYSKLSQLKDSNVAQFTVLTETSVKRGKGEKMLKVKI